MTHDQQRASDPSHSVWVAASAGTGKTKVLTDRVLRLLLGGVPPARILCITYTNAAAAEMEERIEATLGKWAVLSDEALYKALENLMLKPPTTQDMMRARGLFLEVLDAPQRVRIQTIHGFCQSVLKRFPLEADVAPHFTLIDERTAAELIEKAKYALLTDSTISNKKTITALAEIVSEKGFHDLLRLIISQRDQFSYCISEGEESILSALYTQLGISPYDTQESLKGVHFSYTSEAEKSLRQSVQILAQTPEKTNTDMAEKLQQWLEHKISTEDYCVMFLKKDGEPRQRLCTKSAKVLWGGIEDALRIEQQRVIMFYEASQSMRVAECTSHMLRLAVALLKQYQALKEQHAYLDYDDLILHTLQLFLQKEAAAWVLYKLDGGIDHLLLDEAQDTSPNQWKLLDILVHEFFAGEGAGSADRTLFVVGDEKQSIYSFQGADPHIFEAMQQQWSRRLERTQAAFARIRLALSFRSTQAVLSVVDAVFAQPQAREGLIFSEQDISHEAYRAGIAGRVELWPLSAATDAEENQPWAVATASFYTENAYVRCANDIADTIAKWLQEKRILPARGRPVEQGDILILMQRRGNFARAMLRALKQRGIAVAGADRLVITHHLAVMDLMALGDFLLLPQDDLTLAVVLKSPLIGLAEEDIFALANTRDKKSLWQQLRESEIYKTAADFLSSLLAKVDFMPPYELFTHVLEACDGHKKIVTRLGAESEDPIDEFLSLALQYDMDNPASLQGFLHWIRSGNTQIKRDMEKGNDEVRVMTVHGAKGLQAPIVFLADAALDIPKEQNTILWSEGEPALPLWVPVSEYDNAVIKACKESVRKEAECEYRRLLYVAMTRAEDELYITGWSGKKKVPEYCWYELIRTAFEAPALGAEQEGDKWILACGEPAPKASDVALQHKVQANVIVPAWTKELAKTEAPAAKPLAPSHMEDAGSTLSPAGHVHARERGVLIHRLLQYLPDISEALREQAASEYMQRYATAFSASEQQIILQEVQSVLSNPDFAFLWDTAGLSEVPVSGVIEDEYNNSIVISGQIDRLAITEESVLILDYKTNRETPKDMQSVPPVYLKQMKAYHSLMSRIYPGKQVRCALLWTAEPKLMEIIF